MAQNIIDATGTSLANTAKFFFYVKGSKDYPIDQVVSDKFGYDNTGDGTFAQTAIFDTSIKDILIRTTNPKQIDNLYSLYSDSSNGISAKSERTGLNIRNDRSQEYLSSIIIDNGKVMSNEITEPTRFVDHIDPNYTTFEGKTYTLENVREFKHDGHTENNIYPLEHIFWQKIYTICEFIKKYESEIINMYVDSSLKYPSFIRNASDEKLLSWYGSSETVAAMKHDLEAESEIGRFISLFIGKCTDNSKHFQTRFESGEEVIAGGNIRYNPFRWKELTGDDTLRHADGENLSIDEEQEMFYNKDVLNLNYVYGTANFEPSSKEGRIKKFSFEVKAEYTDTISKTWVIVCYLDPDAFVNSSSVAQYAVYTYNDEDMDGAEGAADDNYGIYDNDYANVTSESATLKNNFVSSQSEFQKNIIQAITNIMKDGTYKYYQEFQTLRVTPTIDSENKKNLVWDAVNHSIMQKFYIFYGSESQAPTLAQQIAAVKDYIKRLHTSGHCHPMQYDEDGNITYIGHSDTDLDMFLSKMYPELFTTTEVYIVPTSTLINNLGDRFDPNNYFGTANIEDAHDQIKNLNGVFSLFEYASNGRASLVSSGEKQKNLPLEFIHIGSLNGQETSGQNSLDLRYPMPLICTAFGTTDARPLTSLSGFANYETKIFNYNQSNMNTFNYADKLQIVLIKLMEAMFTNDNNAPYYSSIAGVKIDYEIDRNADSDLQASGYKKNVAKFIINNVNFTVIAHKGKAFAKSLNYVEV